MSSVVASKRVLVTRAQQQAEATAANLSALGYTPLLAPLTQIIPLHDSLHVLAAHTGGNTGTLKIATSARAIEVCLQAGLRDYIRHGSWLVVGTRAATLIAQAGGRLLGTPANDVNGLIARLRQFEDSWDDLVYLCARDRKPNLERAIAQLHALPVYEARAIGGFSNRVCQALRVQGVDWGLVYSARGAKLLAQALEQAALFKAIANTRWALLSDEVADAFLSAGNGAIRQKQLHCAAKPEETDLLALLDAH